MKQPFFRRNALYLAWVVSLIGLCTSLIYGEVLGNPPCPLCWYQRIFLFPLVLILGMAVYRGEQTIVVYALPLAFIGAFFALFHLLQPYIPLLQKSHLCKMGTPCSHEGEIPFFAMISFIGFFVIAWLLLTFRKRKGHG